MPTTATEATCGPFFVGVLVLDPGWTLIYWWEVCKSLRNLVGASGFEPPTSWSRTRMMKRINNLDVSIMIEIDVYMLFLKNSLSHTWSTFIMKRRNASMHGVGIVLGIVDEAGGLRCPLARAGQSYPL